MKVNIVVLGLLASLIVPCVALAQGESLIFRKVDFFTLEGEKEKKHNARLTLYPVEGLLEFSHEKKGAEEKLYASIPYASVTKVVYERSKHRRYKAGLLLSPWLLFSSGKKHWLTIEVEEVASIPEGYVYAQMDKKNYRRILAALKAGLKIEVEEIIEN